MLLCEVKNSNRLCRVRQSAWRLPSARLVKQYPKHQKKMEDYLLSVSTSMADSETGEVLYNSLFHKPLSVLSDDDILKFFHSFQRGVRSGKSVAWYLQVSKERDLPKTPVQTKCF